MESRCKVCGKENPLSATLCSRCGVTLLQTGIPIPGRFELRVVGRESEGFVLASPEHEGYIIGRSDDGTDYLPDIDLAAFGARDQGISRRHAAFVRYNSAVHIIDLDSVNGTYLNSKRLSPDMPYPVNVGDSLQLGNLDLVITYPRR